MPGQAPMQPSAHYGQFGGNFQQNVSSINAAQAVGFNSEQELTYMFESHKSQVSLS